MRLPKYSNPQLIPDDTRIVSRRSLQFEDGVGDDVMQDGEFNGTLSLEAQKDVEDLYKRLDKIVSKRLKFKRVLEASDESPSTKRRKVLAEEREGQPAGLQRLSEPVAFRLVSKSLPPHIIHLGPKPSKVILVKEPDFEDTEEELRERVYRSVLCAVDLKQIRNTFSTQTDRKPPRLLQSATRPRASAAPLLLLEVSSTTPPSLPWINPRLNVSAEPSPHQSRSIGTCCPIVTAIPPQDRDTSKGKGRRKRGKPKNKNKLAS